MSHLFPKSVQSGANLSTEDTLGLLELWGQGVVELAFPNDILGPVSKPCPVQLRRKSGEHWAQVLQVIHHHTQLQREENNLTFVPHIALVLFLWNLFS